MGICTVKNVRGYTSQFVSYSPFRILTCFEGTRRVVASAFRNDVFSMVARHPFAALVHGDMKGDCKGRRGLDSLLGHLILARQVAAGIRSTGHVGRRPIGCRGMSRLLGTRERVTGGCLERGLLWREGAMYVPD